MSRKPNFDVNVDGRTHERTDERTNGRTEIWTPISHPAISRCDKNFVELHSQMLHTKFQNHRPSGSEEEDF